MLKMILQERLNNFKLIDNKQSASNKWTLKSN